MVARALVVVVLLSGVAHARSLERRARDVVRQMRQRGSNKGEIHLVLAALYAKVNDAAHTFEHLKAAQSHGVHKSRVDLVLAEIYRKQGRFDAAMSTLVRVLVRSPRQPRALVQLWKTLYEAKLRGVEVKTDLEAIRERLVTRGLHFPRRFKIESDSVTRSKKLAAAGYTALLGQRHRFAAQLFRAAINALPSNARAHRGLGIALAREHNYARAAGAYLLYLEMSPDAPDADDVDRVLMLYWKSLNR